MGPLRWLSGGRVLPFKNPKRASVGIPCTVLWRSQFTFYSDLSLTHFGAHSPHVEYRSVKKGLWNLTPPPLSVLFTASHPFYCSYSFLLPLLRFLFSVLFSLSRLRYPPLPPSFTQVSYFFTFYLIYFTFPLSNLCFSIIKHFIFHLFLSLILYTAFTHLHLSSHPAHLPLIHLELTSLSFFPQP